MATGREVENSYPDSLAGGSEAIFDHTCQPCSEEETKEAVGFCEDCKEWLCSDCFKFHRRSAASKSHVLYTIKDIDVKVKEKCSEKCIRHNKTIKYHCEDHGAFVCSACLNLDYRNCEKTHYIPEIAKGIASSAEYTDFEERLKHIVTDSDKAIKDLEREIESVQGNFSEILEDIQIQRTAITEAFAKLENELRQEADKRKNDITISLEHDLETYKNIYDQAGEIIKKVGENQHKSLDCDIYISLKRNINKVISLEKTQNATLKNKIVVQPYKFDSNKTFIKELKNDAIGKIKEFSNVCLTHRANINIKSYREIECNAMGLALLPNNRLILTDEKNQKVKLISLEDQKMVFEIGLPGWSWSLAKVNDNKVAVTLPNIKRIIFVTVSDSILSNGRQIKVNGQCRGICATNEMLIVGFILPEKLEILDIHGNFLRKIDVPNTAMNMPCHLFITPYTNIIYASNFGNNTVSKITLDGVHIATYKDEELDDPCQVAMDKFERLLITSHMNDILHMVSSDCRKMKIVLKGSIIQELVGLCYCDQEEKLYIGMKYSDHIKVFDLS